MAHLRPEDFARLASAEPSEADTIHLDSCSRCREMAQAFRDDFTALASLPRRETPTSLWESIEHRARSEGLIGPAQPVSSVRTARRSPWLLAAGALLMFGAGAFSPTLYAVWHTNAAKPPSFALTSPEAERRLAAWETILLTTREAVRQAPRDTVMQSYQRAATAARDQLLSGVRLVSDKRWY